MTQDDRFPGIDQAVALPALLGYLNFSEGRPDPRFQKQFHDAFCFIAEHGSTQPWADLQALLLDRLQTLHQAGGAAFAEISQAEAVVRLALGDVPTAYRAHHRDLLAHQTDASLLQPMFLARVCEAVINQRGPWTETARIVPAAVRQLNDYVGHRPVAVLENKLRGEIYEHERLRPIPLYIRGAGVARGKYHELVEIALKILEAAPESIRTEAYFDPALMDELALDPRAYDFGHPADKRPNYCFGEWDPHLLDTQGRYRRFVVRQILIDGLWQRAHKATSSDHADWLYESAAVLAGTILMASGVCGSGPQTHDSTVTLSNLVPRIARYRETFYAQLLPSVPGKHGERLRKEAQLLKQPFGGVRQALNQYLANQRALQLQQRHLALLFAEIGYSDAARRQVARIPVASVRILTEMQILLTTGNLGIDRGRLDDAAKSLGAIEDLLKRGIACGALADPWNILGFSAQYPRFQSLEDSVRDSRIDDLIHVMDQYFNLYGRLLSEGASAGSFKPDRDLAKEMRRLADWWDRFASTTVSDIDHVHGNEATQSAEHVARSLTRWRQRGAGAADLAFWREQLDGFRTAKAFALVVDALLHKQDFRASASLLMTWLSQSGDVPLIEGEHSFHQLALRWMLGISLAANANGPNQALLELVVKFFDYLEANADEYWQVPRLDVLGTGGEGEGEGEKPEENDDDDAQDSIYSAAYEEMTYKDSTDDNVEGEVLDVMPQKDFDLLHEAERLEKRLQFLATLARLWNVATRCLREAPRDAVPRLDSSVEAWRKRAEQNERSLRGLLNDIHEHDVPKPGGAFDAMIEYDRRRSTKERLLNQVIATCLDHALAVGALRGLAGDTGTANDDSWQPAVLGLERALMSKDAQEARRLLPEFTAGFRDEPLLYTPLSHGGDPQLILQASLAQMLLRGLVHNLPKQGMIRETYQLLRLARSMEAGQTLNGPRITEYDRLFQFGLQAVVDAVVDAAQAQGVEPARLVDALETIVEPFAVTWRDHSQTLRVATLELITHDRDWAKMTEFIKKYGRELFQAKFLAMANLRGILMRGVGAYLKDIQAEPDPLHPLQLIDDLDNGAARDDVERVLQIILQTLIENYDHLRDYNATTTQSDYGDNLHRLFDYLRLKARYDRAAWLLKPLNLVHETLARRDGDTAALWRQRVENITRDSAQKYVQELAKLEKAHGIRLATIRDRIEERFVQPLVLDRLCALIEPALEHAESAPAKDEISPLEKELEPFATTPSGVGLDAPTWLIRLQNELERVRTAQSDLGNLAETAFHVPKVTVPFQALVDQLSDWEKRSREE
ncbi:MAG: hypothetical protein HY289_14035 [Planctomycetes bacterium]|nr:hypothetical protein [Planctomycetota bacterium]